ncbi:MurR/RpiR family transcriptional regulator [Fundicoccus culcitae]|uniref:MurR/RpiR family transcriptional regulator n=1 Tax=Fundicoccus culcitae TaxID=2969821 RepID=A0ABY5P9S2_9LACT|nr:MurR/RpiR family transcriptional regulator [Fundicoccus culcitae]UUX35279.1 MurR/RpiR family transcriptional regulator [Fundicoccus culcitae]
MSLEEIINSVKHFTEAEKEILKYILNNKKKITTMSSTTLAEITYTSPATITRLSKKLGCNGFNELKYLISDDIEDTNRSLNYSNSLELLKNDINSTLDFVDKNDLLKVIDLINQSSKVYVYGTSWGERNSLEMFSRNFLALNIHFLNIPSMTEFQWISNSITDQDLVFIVSYSGENEEVLNLAKKFTYKNISVISITPKHENSLAKISYISLYYKVTELVETQSTRNSEHNLFTTLHILLDLIYRCFLDYNHNNK